MDLEQILLNTYSMNMDEFQEQIGRFHAFWLLLIKLGAWRSIGNGLLQIGIVNDMEDMNKIYNITLVLSSYCFNYCIVNIYNPPISYQKAMRKSFSRVE